MTPHDHIVVELPYPHKLAGFNYTRKRKIGFLFTNDAIHEFRKNNSIDNSKDYEQWVKDNPSLLIYEMFYAAAIAYCREVRMPNNFDRLGLKRAIMLSDEETQKQIADAYSKSEGFGATYKKKVVQEKAK